MCRVLVTNEEKRAVEGSITKLIGGSRKIFSAAAAYPVDEKTKALYLAASMQELHVAPSEGSSTDEELEP